MARAAHFSTEKSKQHQNPKNEQKNMEGGFIQDLFGSAVESSPADSTISTPGFFFFFLFFFSFFQALPPPLQASRSALSRPRSGSDAPIEE
jgi:hypothetical protein